MVLLLIGDCLTWTNMTTILSDEELLTAYLQAADEVERSADQLAHGSHQNAVSMRRMPNAAAFVIARSSRLDEICVP
jgi:hypothetical protein